jgi:hypothetical protein
MQNLINKEIDFWERPWNKEKFDDLYDRDERFFALVIKGVLSWLNSNLLMYNKPIRHFILNTGSSYLYLENNGYEYTWCETSGEDYMYMETPRCLVSVGNFNVPLEELTAPYVRGEYERISNAPSTKGQIVAYNAEMQRLPIEMNLTLKYVFSNFNEAIIFTQELFECVLFQQYFDIIYLGQIIKCSIEINGDTNIQLNEIDLSSKDVNQRTMEFEIKVTTNLPIINEKTESKSSNVINGLFGKISENNSYTNYKKHLGNVEVGDLNKEILITNEILTPEELNYNKTNQNKYIKNEELN